MASGKDIDIMVSNMSGKEFAEYVVKYLKDVKKEPSKNIGIIKANPEKSKNLETATVNLLGQSVDFVAPRKEVYTSESRIPTIDVTTPQEDASRRDFNFNSLFFNIDTNEVEDFTGKGIEDIKNKIVRTPLDPKITFSDDPLRILRAVRFATRLGFELDPELISAAKDPEVQDALRKKISRERIEIELRKMLSGPDPVRATRLIKELGLMDYVFIKPEKYESWEMDQNSRHHDFNVFEHTMQALTNMQEILKGRDIKDADRFVLNMAVLMHDVGKLDPKVKGVKQLADKIVNTYHGHEAVSAQAAEYILRNLPGIKVEEIEQIKKLIVGASKINTDRRDTSEVYNRSRKILGKFVREMGDLWEYAIDLGLADTAGHRKDQYKTHPQTYYQTMKEQIRNFDPKAIQSMKPLLNGTEIMALFNRKGGTWVGEIIKEMLDWQLENPSATNKDAEEFAKKIYLDRGLDKKASISKRAEPYGYWLSPDGKLYPVEYEEHAAFVRRHPEIFGTAAACQSLYDIAYSKRWVRIISNSESELGFVISSPDSEYFNRIKNSLSQLPIKKIIFVDFHDAGYVNALYWDFMEAKSFDELIHKNKTVTISKRAGKLSDFPKKCATCGYVYETLNDFVELTIPGQKETRTVLMPDDPGLICGTAYRDPGVDYVYRNCLCDSTLAIRVPCMHQAQDANDSSDDEPNKYEREKSDTKWGEILIDKNGTKLTRKQIRDYYVKNATKILKEIKGKEVMIYIGTEKNKNILKRNHNDKPIIITNADADKSGSPDNLIYWADRRLLSLHLVMGKKTNLGWVDLDRHGDFPFSKAKDYAKKVASEIKKEFGVSSSIWDSGGTGIHVEFEMKNEMDIDNLREQLKSMLDKLNKGLDSITTGMVKGSGLRSDISTLHEKGNLRARYALGETQGKEKKPLKLSSRE